VGEIVIDLVLTYTITFLAVMVLVKSIWPVKTEFQLLHKIYLWKLAEPVVTSERKAG